MPVVSDLRSNEAASKPSPGVAAVPPQSLESSIRQWGEKLFEYMDAAGAPSLFSAKGLYGALMDWAMKDETFKVQLFRFVDVLPTLTSSSEVSRHLSEYLDNDEVNLNPALRAALKATSFAGGLLGGSIKSQVTGMAASEKCARMQICFGPVKPGACTRGFPRVS